MEIGMVFCEYLWIKLNTKLINFKKKQIFVQQFTIKIECLESN